MAAIMLLTISSFVRLAFGAANADGLIEVQHVHLVGKALPGYHKKLLDLGVTFCAGRGIKVALPPPGTSLHETIDDNYYAPGGMSFYQERKVYIIDKDCRLARRETLIITTWTSLGACKTERETKQSTGYCDVDIASLSRLPDSKSVNRKIVPDGETRRIAGHSCTFFSNNVLAPSRMCIARDGVFAKVLTWPSVSYGALLRMELRSASGSDTEIATNEATEIHTNVMIPITTFAPQLSGKYKVVSLSYPTTESDQ